MSKKLSVVVVPLGGRTYLERCLHALQDQSVADQIEVIVPCDDRCEQDVSGVNFVRSAGRHSLAELRATGFHAATAPIVALTEDQCIPDQDWCGNILRAHELNHSVIGGAVDKAQESDTGLNWAVYFCDYSRYANPVCECAVSALTDCNVSYKRDKLNSIASLWEHEFHENVVHKELLKQSKMWISPCIVVRQQRDLSALQAIRERYTFGRLFGRTRAASSSFIKRFLYGIVALLLPLLLTARIARNVFSKKRYRGAFFRSLPWIIVLNIVWSVGELLGSLTGRRSLNETT
jgi:Glycosyl transferase family 2